ncbi:MAG: zinc ribbon domain-containing protein [Thermodesulfobacteriota bacterium]
MIFIGGVQPKTRNLEASPRTCPVCGSPQAYLKRTDHYISLFFIPLIPISRGRPFLACEGCGRVLDERGDILEELRAGMRRICPGCGQRTDPSFRFCPYCGEKLP